MATRRARPTSKKYRINMRGVKKEITKGGGRVRIPDGDYVAKIANAELKESEKSGSKYFQWDFQITEGKYKGKVLKFFNTSLKPDALWNLRNLIFAATGKNVAGKVIEFDPDTLIGKTVGISVEEEEYNDKISSRVQSVIPADEVNAEEDADDDEDEDEEEDEEEEDDEEDDEDEDLEDVDVEDI